MTSDIALAKIEPITLVIVVLLVILVFSYRQVIEACPDGRGCYAVSKAPEWWPACRTNAWRLRRGAGAGAGAGRLVRQGQQPSPLLQIPVTRHRAPCSKGTRNRSSKNGSTMAVLAVAVLRQAGVHRRHRAHGQLGGMLVPGAHQNPVPSGAFRPVPHPVEAIYAYLDAYDADLKPFVWTVCAEEFPAKGRRGRGWSSLK